MNDLGNQKSNVYRAVSNKEQMKILEDSFNVRVIEESFPPDTQIYEVNNHKIGGYVSVFALLLITAMSIGIGYILSLLG